MTAFYQLPSWMSSLPEAVRERSLSELVLPGSHDSAGCTTMDNKLTEEWSKEVAGKRRHLPYVKHALERWTHTQSLTIAEQLEMGTRHFDFRLSCKPNKSVFYFSHGLICTAAMFTMYTIYNYLQLHRGEVVVVSIRPDVWHQEYLSKEKVDEFLKNVHGVCGQLLIPKAEAGQSVDSLCKAGHRLLLNYFGECSSQAWVRKFDSVQEAARLPYSLKIRIAQVKQSIKKAHSEEWEVLSFPVDPTTDQLQNEIYKLSSFGLKELSKEMHEKMYELLNPRIDVLKQKFNAVEIDFVDESFIRFIVALNYN